MKKSNRIERKGAISTRKGQGKHPVKNPAKRAYRGRQSHPTKASGFPFHRLFPRTASQLRELRAFVRNLGEHVASAVLECGDSQHLYRHGSGWLRVDEYIKLETAKEQWLYLADAWGDHETLEECLRRYRGCSSERYIYFEIISRQKAAEWAERFGVVDGLSIARKRELWDEDEVDGLSKGRVILTLLKASDHSPVSRVYDRCGVFTEENLLTGETKRVERMEALRMVRSELLIPMLNKVVPSAFRDDFRIDFPRPDRFPANAANIVAR